MVTGTARRFTYERARHGGMGLLHARLEQERCSSVAVHGVMTTNQCPVAQQRAHKHGTKERKQHKGSGKPWFSQRGKGVDVAGLTETVGRFGCSRRCPASHSASASPPRRGHPLPSRRLVRWRVGGDAAHDSFLPASTPTPPPLSFLPCGGAHKKGVNPKRALACARGSALCYWRPVKAAQGQRSADGAPIGGFPRGGDVDGHQWWLSPLSVIGRGKRGNFPSQNPLEWVTGARASLTCVPALRPGGPIRAHGCGAPSAMWCGEALGRTEKKTVWPTCGPHTPVRGKKRGEALVSWAAQVKRLMG
jgi:hypothetical protein